MTRKPTSDLIRNVEPKPSSQEANCYGIRQPPKKQRDARPMDETPVTPLNEKSGSQSQTATKHWRTFSQSMRWKGSRVSSKQKGFPTDDQLVIPRSKRWLQGILEGQGKCTGGDTSHPILLSFSWNFSSLCWIVLSVVKTAKLYQTRTQVEKTGKNTKKTRTNTSYSGRGLLQANG